MNNPLASIRAYIKEGAHQKAAAFLCEWLNQIAPYTFTNATINQDGYSLNSANGTLEDTNQQKYFFKFHQEEGEEQTLSEYYNVSLLEQAGYPVSKPCFVNQKPGEQILIYPFATSPRLADICLSFEQQPPDQNILYAQENLDKLTLEIYKNTLHQATPQEYQSASILQLFFWRMVAGTPQTISHEWGARLKTFYLGKPVPFPNHTILFDDILDHQWVINTITYPKTLRNIIQEAILTLSPRNITMSYPAVIAHGDAHNANVWYHGIPQPHLTLFDPAFAGRHIHALLAEVKSTFHNIFAHPYWMYHAHKLAPYTMPQVHIDNHYIHIEHDWHLTPLRQAFLDIKLRTFWRPWLNHLQAQHLLPPFAELMLQSALFCCPFLVKSLLPPHIPTTTSDNHIKAMIIGFSQAIKMAHWQFI